MTELVTATVVRAAGDWQGVYIDDELRYENHSASVEDASIQEEEAIDEVVRESYEITRLGRTSLPASLSELEQLSEFAETIKSNVDDWSERLQTAFTENDGSMKLSEVESAFSVDEDERRVILACFSADGVRAKKTPIGIDPIVELNTDSYQYDYTEYELVD